MLKRLFRCRKPKLAEPVHLAGFLAPPSTFGVKSLDQARNPGLICRYIKGINRTNARLSFLETVPERVQFITKGR
ncbi:hypothetical protein D3C80_1371480 [compost metagenome]